MRDILIDFGLPAMILIMLFVLMLTGTNGEVKALMAATVGWILKSGIQHKIAK